MLKKLIRSERGFTLVELLVTIAIMGVLFGIVTLALNGLSTNTTTATKAAELDMVQTAVDIYLAANYPGTTAITARASSDAGLITSTDTDVDFDAYLRSLPTEYSYYWDTDGNVTQP
jgi:prepilin-type N-terminal cleavage/methylation domain-containing protein